MTKSTVIVHSGGMDSSLCLAIALKEYKPEEILSLSFSYQQRHSNEIEAAKSICNQWNVEHAVVDLSLLAKLTSDALTNRSISTAWQPNEEPPSLVVGRNGLMARLAAIHAHQLGANSIYMGIMEEEAREIGYRDCSNDYIRLKEKILKIDLDRPNFEIRTPLIDLRKDQTFELAYELGVLPFLLEHSISCYEGIPKMGCQKCPSCFLRNRGLQRFKDAHPDVALPY